MTVILSHATLSLVTTLVTLMAHLPSLERVDGHAFMSEPKVRYIYDLTRGRYLLHLFPHCIVFLLLSFRLDSTHSFHCVFPFFFVPLSYVTPYHIISSPFLIPHSSYHHITYVDNTRHAMPLPQPVDRVVVCGHLLSPVAHHSKRFRKD